MRDQSLLSPEAEPSASHDEPHIVAGADNLLNECFEPAVDLVDVIKRKDQWILTGAARYFIECVSKLSRCLWQSACFVLCLQEGIDSRSEFPELAVFWFAIDPD